MYDLGFMFQVTLNPKALSLIIKSIHQGLPKRQKGTFIPGVLLALTVLRQFRLGSVDSTVQAATP